ncbi:MAG: phage tail protein [Magnetococcales bacterium]|nr:phage tail protein [Magnetococcales bacterium]
MTVNPMLSLGKFKFSINTAAYQSLKRTVEYNWPCQARGKRKPSLQYAGMGNETVSLNGVIYPHFKGGVDQINNMRKMASEGKPLILGDAKGINLGKWVITRIEETQTNFFIGGTPKKVEFNVELKAYGEDSDAAISN